jgi:hypothetical protein
MLEKTPSENFCQKGPAVGGGTRGRRHVAPAAVGIAGRPLPPLASPACGLAWRRRGGRQHAATPTGGRWQGRGHAATPIGGRGPCRHPHWRQVLGHVTRLNGGGRAGDANGGRGLPAMPTAAGATCRLPRGCRHPQLVLFDKIFRRGFFLAFHSRRWSHMSKILDLL